VRKECLIGLAINKRELDIELGVPKDQAWVGYFRELVKITGDPFFDFCAEYWGSRPEGTGREKKGLTFQGGM